MRLWTLIIHVAERAFVEGVLDPSVSLVILGVVLFAKQEEKEYQTKKELKK